MTSILDSDTYLNPEIELKTLDEVIRRSIFDRVLFYTSTASPEVRCSFVEDKKSTKYLKVELRLHLLTINYICFYLTERVSTCNWVRVKFDEDGTPTRAESSAYSHQRVKYYIDQNLTESLDTEAEARNG